jgi:hypothetical protein
MPDESNPLEERISVVEARLTELERRLNDVNDANWRLNGHLGAVDMVLAVVLGIVLTSDRSPQAKAKALALIDQLRTAARGHAIDRATPEGERGVSERSEAMDDFLSHVTENLRLIRPDWE